MFCLNVYLFIWRERAREQGRCREREIESQAGSALSVQSQMWGSPLQTMTPEPLPRVGCLTNWATQVPLPFLSNPYSRSPSALFLGCVKKSSVNLYLVPLQKSYSLSLVVSLSLPCSFFYSSCVKGWTFHVYSDWTFMHSFNLRFFFFNSGNLETLYLQIFSPFYFSPSSCILIVQILILLFLFF